MSGDVHVRFYERPWGRFPRATHLPITGVVQRKFALLDRHLLELHNAVSGVSKEQFAND